MKSFRRCCLASLAVLSLLAASRAQCVGPQVKISQYGRMCEFFGQPSDLRGSYDAATCTMTLSLSKVTTCCNTFARSQILLIGLRPIDPGIEHGLLVAGCLVSVVPDIALAQPASSGGVWTFQLPPVPLPVRINFQGLTEYFTTIGFSSDFQTSTALRVDLL